MAVDTLVGVGTGVAMGVRTDMGVDKTVAVRVGGTGVGDRVRVATGVALGTRVAAGVLMTSSVGLGVRELSAFAVSATAGLAVCVASG